MDSIHYYENIKKLSSGTVIELANEIEKLYNSMAIDEKYAFVIYLEFDFLANLQNEIKSDEKSQGLYRFMAEYDKIVAELNKSKQHYKFLTSWVEQKKSDNLKVELTEINASDNKSIANYLGQPANDEAINFFEFLCENYRPEESTKVKYVNILYFLKNNALKKHFIFKLKQDDYKKMVKKNTGIIINKFEKSATYEETEKPIFHSLENTFLKNMKI